MPLPLQRKKPGDRLAIPARDWNAAMDAARAEQARQRALGGAGVGGIVPNPVVVRVKNASGSDVKQAGILGIDGPIFAPTTDPNAGAILLLDLKGITPTSDHYGAFAVTLEPIGSNAVGRAVISGACWVKVNVAAPEEGEEESAAEDFRFAEANESLTALKAVPRGSAQILWKQSGTGDKWAIVNIGGKPGPELLYVTLEEDGSGSAGDNTTQASWRYTVFFGGVEIAVEKSPEWRAWSRKANAATAGIALVLPSGSVNLLIAFEAIGGATPCA